MSLEAFELLTMIPSGTHQATTSLVMDMQAWDYTGKHSKEIIYRERQPLEILVKTHGAERLETLEEPVKIGG